VYWIALDFRFNGFEWHYGRLNLARWQEECGGRFTLLLTVPTETRSCRGGWSGRLETQARLE
jgi:hypothetical protein